MWCTIINKFFFRRKKTFHYLGQVSIYSHRERALDRKLVAYYKSIGFKPTYVDTTKKLCLDNGRQV